MGRAPCCDKASVKRGPWSPEEDDTLRTYVQTHGTGGNWITLPRRAGPFIFLPFLCYNLLCLFSEMIYTYEHGKVQFPRPLTQNLVFSINIPSVSVYFSMNIYSYYSFFGHI